MKFVFLIDPLETLDLKKDTSYLIMQGAEARGHDIYILYKKGITVEDKSVFLHIFQIKLTPDKKEKEKNPFIISETKKVSCEKIDALLIRTDPPFDEEYIQLTWFLDLMADKVFILNHPQGIRDVNEKIWACRFPHLMPPTLITANLKDYEAFIQKHGRIVVKPTNGFGGKNVFISAQNDSNVYVIFESVLEVSQYVVAQKYVPGSEMGDKRVLLLDGEPIGSIMRVHGKKDHRNNFLAGGSPKATQLTSRDLKIIEELKPFLKEKKLYFVGIDILGEFLTEVNVTSPTCLREMKQMDGSQPEEKVVRFIEKKVRSLGEDGEGQKAWVSSLAY